VLGRPAGRDVGDQSMHARYGIVFRPGERIQTLQLRMGAEVRHRRSAECGAAAQRVSASH